jgi:hypothetical protein
LKSGGYPEALLRRGVTTGERRIGEDARAVQDPIADFWNRPKIPVTRYSRGKLPVLYSSESKVTALREVCNYFYDKHSKHSSRPLPKLKQMLLYTVEVGGSFLDLRGKHKEEPRLVHPTDYSYCQDVAVKARKTVSFIQAPSARDYRGICFPIFSPTSAVGRPNFDTVDMKLKAKTQLYHAVVDKKTETIDIHDVYSSVI